jgi:hypothetical protein
MPCMTTIDHMAFDAIPTLKANLARGYASLTKVLQDKTTVHRAMYREGVGWIDFIWGDEGRWPPSNKGRRKGARGLSHTIEARQRKDNLTYREVIELLGRMVLAIAEGEESLRIPVGKSERIIVGRDGTEVHLLKRPGSNAWTLTVFDVWKDGEGDALDAACDAIQPTRYGATPGRTVTVAPSMVSDADLRLRAWTHSLCGRQAGADDITSVGHAAVHRNLDSTDSDLIARIEAAAQESAFGHNPRPIPSEAQCAAGNYKLGRVDWRGLKLAIEQPRNSYREGTDKNGVKWRTRLAAHYGYISGTRGADGDPVDCFIGTFPTAETAYVINQYVDGRFDEHKLMLCFMDEPSAIRAYLDSYDRGWSGLHSIVPASITQLRWWLQNGNLSRQLTPESLPFEGKSTMLKPAHNVYWDYAACEPREDSIPAILYRLRAEDPGNDLLMDSVSLADIYSEADAILTFDAMVTPYAKLEARLNILKAVMERSGGAVKPVALQISEPFKQRGVANVAGVFELSDGQTVSVFFHNPDVTPKKIQPADELISWKWLLNKKDITIVVAPEQGHDLNVREVARRLMKLAEKNSAAFVRANAKRAERMQSIEALKSEAARKEAELADLNHQIEVAKVEREDRDASGAELPPQTIKNASEETLAYVGMNADGDAVYQNDAGARWLRKKNLLTGEATKGGKPVEPREDEYLTAEELAATKNANAAEGQKRYEPTPAIAASMSSNEIPADKEDAHQYRKAAFEIIRTRYGNKPPVPITTKDGSIVLVGMGGLKHVLKDGLPSWQETVATLHAEEIIANADYLGSEPDYKKRTEIKAVHRYGASIEIDGEEYGAVIVVMEASDGKRYYDHTVTAKGESPAGLLADPSTTEVDEESGRPFTGLPDNQNINQLPLKSTDPDTPEVEVPALIEVAKVEAEDGKATMRTWQDASGRQSDPAEGAAIIETWDATKADALLVETQTGQEDATPEAVARKFIAQHLQGRLVRTRIGDCLINSVTKGKLPQAAGRKGGLKLMAVARVPEILIHGEVGSLEENHKERSDTFDGFYPFTHTLQFDDKLVQARIKVGHRAQTPNLVYSLDVSRVALDSTQKDESPNLTRRCTSVSAVVDLGLEGASDFREELFRGPGVPSEPTTEPGSTSSSLLTMDSMVEQDDNGINIVILKVIDKKTGERLYDLEDDVGQEGHEPKPEPAASLSSAEEAAETLAAEIAEPPQEQAPEVAAGVEVPALPEDIQAKLEKLAGLAGKSLEETRAAYDKWVSAKGESAALQALELTIANRKAANLASEAGILVTTLKQYGAVLAKKADSEIDAVTYANRKQATAAAAKIDAPGIEAVVVGNRPFYVKIIVPSAEAAAATEESGAEEPPKPAIAKSSPLDEFEQAGGEPWQVTQAKWVEIMRGHMRSLGQSEESGTAAAPYSDYEQFHKEKVRQAITEGKPIPAEVLADYPDLQAAPVDVQPPEPVTASETEEPPTITLTGKEFGDFPDTEEGKKALRSAAIDYYDKELMGRDGVLNVALDKVVEFNAEGRNKIKSFSADPRKLHLVHALRSIVASGKPTPISPLKPHAKAAKKGVVAVHVLKTPVMLGGERIKARFLVYEKADGHLFYDHSVDRGEMMAAMGRSSGAMDSADAADLDSSVLLSDEPSSEHRRTDTVGDSHEGFNLDDATIMAAMTPMVFNLVIDEEEPETVEPKPTEDPQKTTDTAFLQSVIDGQADILDPDFAGKLEALFGAYANDPDMLDLLNRAITAYSEAMMGKASSAMAA